MKPKLNWKINRFTDWSATDVDNREIIAIHVSTTRTSLDVLYFMRRVLECCENEPLILVDGGPWYSGLCRDWA